MNDEELRVFLVELGLRGMKIAYGGRCPCTSKGTSHNGNMVKRLFHSLGYPGQFFVVCEEHLCYYTAEDSGYVEESIDAI